MNGITLNRWTRATFLGWLLSVAFIMFLSGIFDGLGIEGYQCYVGIGVGMGVGLTQWLTLRKRAGFSSRWLWYTIIGIGTPFLIFDLLKHFGHFDFGDRYLLYSVSIAGLSAGILQYLILKQYTSKAAGWIALSFAGWLLAGLTVLVIDISMKHIKQPLIGFIVNLSLILAGGVVLGIITGRFIEKAGLQKT